MARFARTVLLAILGIGVLSAMPASARTSDPLDFFRKYVGRPIDKALQAPAPAKSRKPKIVRVRAVDVPIPRLKPALSVSAGVDADWRPPVQVASLSAEGWSETPVAGGAPAGSAAASTTDEAAPPAPAPAMPAPPVPAPEASTNATDIPAPPLPVLKPAPPKQQQLASLPPRPDVPRVTPDTLAALGVKSVPLPPISDGDCFVTHPVAVASLGNGNIKFSAKATLNEPMAEMVAEWVNEDIAPAAHSILKEELTGLRIAASYDCRSRDNIKGAKLSEHAFGNALDVSAFEVGTRWIEVGDKTASAEDQRFLDAVRYAACKRFNTVLGPGEPYHDTHFHVDLEHRGKTGNNKLCE